MAKISLSSFYRESNNENVDYFPLRYLLSRSNAGILTGYEFDVLRSLSSIADKLLTAQSRASSIAIHVHFSDKSK